MRMLIQARINKKLCLIYEDYAGYFIKKYIYLLYLNRSKKLASMFLGKAMLTCPESSFVVMKQQNYIY